MTKLVYIIAAFALSFCSTTKQPTTRGHSGSQNTATKTANKTALVDANWMAKYKAAEGKFGYRIQQDSQIKAEGGKFRVPQEVIDHNLDMTKVKSTKL